MTTATNPALLRRICLHTDDTDVRRVYSDWLEEVGEVERADLIRVQLELAAGKCTTVEPHTVCYHSTKRYGCCCKCRMCWLQDRETDLLLHADTWAQSVWLACGIPDTPQEWSPNGKYKRYHHACTTHATDTKRCLHVRWEFRRGFIESITTTCDLWLAHGPTIVQVQPVRQVVLDREPEPRIDEAGFGWYKRHANSRTSGDVAELPAWLWDLLPPGTQEIDGERTGVWMDFATRELALAALSTAALTWARRSAGLEVPCAACDGWGGNDPVAMNTWTCRRCNGTGWRTADA